MMLSSACMSYLNDKLIGFKPNKDSYAYQAYQETLTLSLPGPSNSLLL